MIKFELRLRDTYWSNGFFNVSVDFQRYITMTDGPIQIFLGDIDTPVVGRISRSANRNATPRIFGNKPLAEFFQKNFKKGSSVPVEIISVEAIRIGSNHSGPPAIVPSVGTPVGPRKAAPLVSGDQLSTWRRALIGILNDLDPRVQRGPDEGVAKRIRRLSNDGAVPREVAAMMRVVTEMRNMTEYQAKVLSASESAAVISAWGAIRQWADTRGSKK
ncbi:MAG TPA: hypothetical protein VEL79_02065 [Vicinamibacterales bacterium]|nr:hypothetical protein [Vicinamibacterales bacterium]